MKILSAEHRAAIDWTRITEAPDRYASALVTRFGYAESLAMVREGVADLKDRYPSVARWHNRLSTLEPFHEAALPKLGVRVLIPSDDDWPVQVDDLGDSRPLALWVRGSSELLMKRSIAIVGSRDASDYGCKIARDLAFDIGIPVVSGGAFGIDAEAHRGALLAESSTIIVSAGGVDRPYPSAHRDLYLQTLKNGGAVISESPLAAAPQRHRFLSRNRIIAALAAATIVVEAPYRSGALSTARHALEIGRPVGAFPGPVNSPYSAGTHELIRSSGTLVASTDHVRQLIEPIGVQLELGEFFDGGVDDDFDPRLERVWEATPVRRAASAASISGVAGLTLAEASTALGKLAMRGRVVNKNGSWVRA